MAKQLKDRGWLKQQLVDALHWDEDVAEGIIGLIVNSTSPADVEEITAAYMDNNPVAVCAVSDFLEARQTSKQQPQAHSQGSREQQPVQGRKSASNHSTNASIAPLPASQASARQVPQQDKWLQLGGQPSAAQQGATPAAENNQQVSSLQQAEATLSMFRKGGRLKSRPAAGSSSSGRRKGEQLDAITADLERKVANCLHCGKIFDCRSVTNEIMRFIDSGFKCTFCGAAVAMSQQQRIQQAQQHGTGSSSSSNNTLQGPAEDAQAKAVAFKDRLVEYDRHSHKRTTVIDDQSDFFEIDTNAWLTEEERAELRRRAQLAEEAAAARRNKVIVTLDLLGRKVVMTDGPQGSLATGGDSSSSSFEVVGSSATHQLLQQVQAAAGHSSGHGNANQQGSNSSSSSTVQPGGTARSEGGKAPAETLADALEAISNLRISANPGLTTTPLFVSRRRQQLQQQSPQQPHAQDNLPEKAGRQTNKQKQQKQQQQQEKAGKCQSKATAGQQGLHKQRTAVSAAANRAAAADRRVQDDSIFEDFEAELLCDELLQRQPAQHVTAT